MRLYSVLPSLYASLIFVAIPPNAIAIHPQAIARQADNPFKPGPQRQTFSSHGNLPPRTLINTCASIDTGLLTELGPLMGLEFPDSILTKSHLCLCIKDLDFYLDTTTDVVILTSLVGRDTLKASLEVLIKTSPSRKECVPANSTTHAHAADICTCTPPLTTYDKNCNAKPSGGRSALSTSKHDSTPAPAQAMTERKRGEMTRVRTSVDPYTSLRFSEGDGLACSSCDNIPDTKGASYIGGLRVADVCTIGRSSSSGRSAYVRNPKVLSLRMRRVKTRDTSSDGITLDFHIVVDLTHIMRALNNLRVHSDSLRANFTLVDTSVVLASTDEIIQVGTKIFLSHSIGSLLKHTMDLSNLAQQVDVKLSDYAFGEDPRLYFTKVEVGALIDLTADILNWYRNSVDVHVSPDPNTCDIPFTVSLSQLFDNLGLGKIETTIKASDLGGEPSNDTNGLLDDLSVSFSGEQRKEMARDLGMDSLLKQVEALVGLVLELGNLGSLLASKAERSVKLATLAPVSLATFGLVTSTDISGLSNSLDLIVLASANARTTLSKYGDCGLLVDELLLVVKTAMATKASCEEFSPNQKVKLPFPVPTLEPVPIPAPTVHAYTTDTLLQPKGAPVVVVLDGLLHRLGLSDVSANMTIDGLGAGLSGTLNGVLNMLHAGGRKMAREENRSFSSVVFSDPALAKVLTTAVENAIDLELESANPGPVASLLTGLLPPVLGSLQAVLGSPTVTGLVLAVDGLSGSAREMNTLLTDCNCATASVLESSGRFVTAVIGIQGWVNEYAGVVRTEGTNE